MEFSNDTHKQPSVLRFLPQRVHFHSSFSVSFLEGALSQMRKSHPSLTERIIQIPAHYVLVTVTIALAYCPAIVPQAIGASLYLPQDSMPLQHNRELQTLQAWLERQRGTVIAMQRELVALPALNPEHGGVGEERKLQWVEARLRQYGITDFERLDFTDDRIPGKVRGNLIARLRGRPGELARRRTLWLISHMDVFPPGQAGEWRGDPFTLRVEGDTVYGRGTEDNNQAIVTSLLLVEAFQASGIVPTMDIGLLFCPGALTNYAMNIEHVMDSQPGIFSPDDLVLLMDYGSESGAFIEVAEKANVWLKFTVSGKEGHAGSP